MLKNLSWNDRFAIIDAYTLNDDVVCTSFGVSKDEIATARQLRAAGNFVANTHLDTSKYAGMFTMSKATPSVTQPTVNTTVTTTTSAPATKQPRSGTATTHTKPETATSKKAVNKVPGKRGRKGDKIVKAFQSVTNTPTPVDVFIKQYGVSLAVLRQSKRFLEKMEPSVAQSIGKINVRQEKGGKALMIWREDI